MEMEKVPAAGYEIKGITVAGFYRRKLYKNFAVILKLLKGLHEARRIIRDFSPDVVIGVGGYVSGPVLKIAQRRNIPTFIQEQNSYAGLTNKLLARKAAKIFVAFPDMDKYFPPSKILLTGNPVRRNIANNPRNNQTEIRKKYNIPTNKKVVLLLGGSLGARTINESVIRHVEEIEKNNTVFILQTGNPAYEIVKNQLPEETKNVRVLSFIADMGEAYALADVIVSRAGAMAISELQIIGKPTILVPSPNVVEDHQTKNAMAIVRQNAAILVKDTDALTQLVPTINELITDKDKQSSLAKNLKALARTSAAQAIAKAVL